MSDLTREEIRRAVEATPGWSWTKGDPKNAGSIAELDRAYDDEGFLRFLPYTSRHESDALALLRATGETCNVQIRPDGSALVVIPPKDDHHEGVGYDGEDLPQAAVRAVNQATAQTPGAEPREGGETP